MSPIPSLIRGFSLKTNKFSALFNWMAASLPHIRYVLLKNPLTLLALVLFMGFLVLALLGPSLVAYDPLATDAVDTLKPPSAAHWFGTDQLGRDILSRVVVATRMDLFIAVAAVMLSFVVGSIIGAAAGYYGAWIDRITGRLLDTIMAFPLFVLAMAIVAAMGNTVENIVYATAIINLPFYARVARAEVNVLRHTAFVEAALISGNSHFKLLCLQVFPNAMPPMMVQLSLNMGWAILNAAGLSFIGLGVKPPDAEWGIMVAEGANYIISGEWWVALFPGAMLMLAVFCFNLLGDGLRDLLDARKKT